MAYTTRDIRNIALLGSSGSGKTLLTEAMLFASGGITAKGSIAAGTTVSDTDTRERTTQHSISPTVCHFDHQGVHINVIDTPGARDFYGKTLSVLSAVETAALVINAQSGVDAMTQQLLNAARERRLCCMVVVNRIDAEGVDLGAVTSQVREILGSECMPINLPSYGRDDVVDCFGSSEGPATTHDAIEDANIRIVEQVVEMDEELMELYLEEGELPHDKLHDAFGIALRDGHVIPICYTSAETDVGIAELLRVIKEFMADPTAGNPIRFMAGGESVSISPNPDGALLAHVFKISIDPFRGQLATVRLHRGTMRAGGQVYFDDARKPSKIGHVLKLNGASQLEVPAVVAGDICALPRASEASFNCVLQDARDESGLCVETTSLPNPAYGLAVRTENDADAQKVSDSLQTAMLEDPSIRVEHVAAQNETVLRGMGEVHLRDVLERITSHYGMTIETSFPAIAYRETITSRSEGHHRHKKQTGGAGQFGEVFLRAEPIERGSGFEFVNQVVGGVIPGQFIPAVEKGVRQVMASGAISGHEMQDIRVTVYDGKHHPVDSKEVAFVQAGKRAFMNAIAKARAIIMEPVVSVQVSVPNDRMGDVAGDLSSMGGMVSGSTVMGGTTVVEGRAPLREMQSYHSRLNSISGGEGSFSMEFSHYERVQPELQKELVSKFRPQEEE